MMLLNIIISFIVIAAIVVAILARILCRRSTLGKTIILVLLAGVLFLIFLVHRELYPPDSFYEGEFKRITGHVFPESGEFIFKESSYPDIHGDYSSCAVVEVSAQDYSELRLNISAINTNPAEDECMYHLWSTLTSKELIAESSQCDNSLPECKYWALLADGRRVIIHYASW